MGLLNELAEPTRQKLEANGKHKLASMYEKCFCSTWETTVQNCEDGTVFLITGDIPAMWLRDSSAQVRHYLPMAEYSNAVAELIEGLLRRQFRYIAEAPYANAFNKEPNGAGHAEDKPGQPAIVWERKYEIDSLCYPLHLAYDFWRLTGRTGWHDESFAKAARLVLDVWKTEQRHDECSPYSFERANCPPTDTLPCGGKGTPTGYTGMTWSGFRPSDDACEYGYLIHANLFAAAVLAKLAEIARELSDDSTLADEATCLAQQIKKGVEQYAVVEHPRFGRIYAYETDGLGNYNLMDDANVPSLLSLPYLGCPIDEQVYQNTRRFILSAENPYYYEGSRAKGVGSPHTPLGYFWPIALCMQGLTTTDKAELDWIAKTLENTDDNTLCMHEGINTDNPAEYTRPWFAWANSLFSEFMAYYASTL